MKHLCCTIFLLQLLLLSSYAQEVSRIGDKSEVNFDYYQMITDYLNHQKECVVLNSVIEVNGIFHSKDTYGYIDYVNLDGVHKRCLFEQLGGVIRLSKKDYEDILKMPDSSKVCIAICLQSPVVGSWGGSWDMVIVKGFFDVSQLITTRSSLLSPCFHFIITSVDSKLFKIQLCSWKVQAYYYSTESAQITSRQRKKLDLKERRIYKRANLLDFKRELW